MLWRIKQSFFKTKWEEQLCFGFDDFSFHIGGFGRFLMPFKGFHCNHIVHSGRRFLGKVKSSKFCSSTQSTRWSQLWEVCWISWSRMFNFSKGSQEECDLHKYLYCNHLNLFNAQYKANQCNCDSTSGFCFRKNELPTQR